LAVVLGRELFHHPVDLLRLAGEPHLGE
jgi:hypothetical protein